MCNGLVGITSDTPPRVVITATVSLPSAQAAAAAVAAAADVIHQNDLRHGQG